MYSLISHFTFTDVICCKQKRKLHMSGNTKLAIMPTLPTLCKCEKLEYLCVPSSHTQFFLLLFKMGYIAKVWKCFREKINTPRVGYKLGTNLTCVLVLWMVRKSRSDKFKVMPKSFFNNTKRSLEDVILKIRFLEIVSGFSDRTSGEEDDLPSEYPWPLYIFPLMRYCRTH